jgi:nucleotide-binding universal stress UspA family protein
MDLVLMSADITNGASVIVAGVDGSASSRAALRWAVGQAKLTGATVAAVIAWQIPLVPASSGYAPIYVAEEGDFEKEATRTIEAVLGDEVGPADSQRVEIRVRQGHPAQVLLDAAADADLLVVGRRGHGSFAEALLGSVSQHCVHHAQCPVLIMHAESDQAGA